MIGEMTNSTCKELFYFADNQHTHLHVQTHRERNYTNITYRINSILRPLFLWNYPGYGRVYIYFDYISIVLLYNN